MSGEKGQRDRTAAAQKTLPHSASVSAFLDAVPDARRREDAKSVAELMASLTGEPAVMWGGMAGFGRYFYTHQSGIFKGRGVWATPS
jgi:hypothetical protein